MCSSKKLSQSNDNYQERNIRVNNLIKKNQHHPPVRVKI